MDPDQVTGSRFEKIQRRYTFLVGKADPLIFRGRQICSFWRQNGASLWRADLSFKNSVTGSRSIAKCSNILQDSVNDMQHNDTQQSCLSFIMLSAFMLRVVIS
jgi:hypothetical protein